MGHIYWLLNASDWHKHIKAIKSSKSWSWSERVQESSVMVVCRIRQTLDADILLSGPNQHLAWCTGAAILAFVREKTCVSTSHRRAWRLMHCGEWAGGRGVGGEECKIYCKQYDCTVSKCHSQEPANTQTTKRINKQTNKQTINTWLSPRLQTRRAVWDEYQPQRTIQTLYYREAKHGAYQMYSAFTKQTNKSQKLIQK